nr:MAG TPA: hypothetical protein [Caudoviricetes sp.]
MSKERFSYENVEVKPDCFAYNSKSNSCKCLTDLYCKKELCSFYKSKETHKDNLDGIY